MRLISIAIKSLEMDIYGHHALVCKKGATLISRHNSGCYAICDSCKGLSIPCSLEAPNPMNITRERPGDIYFPEFDEHGDGHCDYSDIHIAAASYVYKSSKGLLEGSKIRYDYKKK